MNYMTKSTNINLKDVSRLRNIAYMQRNNGHVSALELYKKLQSAEARSVAKMLFGENPKIEDVSLRELAERLHQSILPVLT